MESPSSLLDCQLLVYILSLLDEVKDVNSCQLSCRKLRQLINENRHQMAKHKVVLDLANDPVLEADSKGPVYILRVDNVDDKFSERHAEASNLENRITVEYFKTGTVQLYFNKIRSKNEKQTPSLEWVSLDIQEEVKKHIVQCFQQFEIRYFAPGAFLMPEDLCSFIVETVRRFGLKMQSCYISSMALKELPVVMGCSFVFMRLVGVTDYHELMQNFPFDKMEVRIIQFGPDPCMQPLIALLNQWCNGEREIRMLSLVFSINFPSDDVMTWLLGQYNVIHTNNVVSERGMHQIEAFIGRDCDNKTLRFAHGTNRTCRAIEIWLHS